MNSEEANKIINEFMDELKVGPIIDNGDGTVTVMPFQYSKSLDSLVPVWKKLSKVQPFNDGLIIYSCIIDELDESFNVKSNWVGEGKIDVDTEYDDDCNPETLQEAAAIATAKAIQEL